MRYHVFMMKRIGLLIFFMIFAISHPCCAEVLETSTAKNQMPKIFTYHIPDEDIKSDETTTGKSTLSEEISKNIEQPQDIISDDITADTSGEEVEEDYSEDEMDEPEIEEYQIGDMYSDVLKGYAQYDEGEGDAVFLSDSIDEIQTIKLSKPQKVGCEKYAPLMNTDNRRINSSMNTLEYSIAPISGTSYAAKKGGFSAGTTYNQGIDYAELEQSTGVFSRYETKHFAISTSYARTINSTNNNYNDNVYLSPELIINQYFSLREVLSADIVKNRKTAEMIFSINPFGKKDTDRLRLELGASSVYDDKNALLKNQFKFSTKFQL